jgi:hypothetical protein
MGSQVMLILHSLISSFTVMDVVVLGYCGGCFCRIGNVEFLACTADYECVVVTNRRLSMAGLGMLRVWILEWDKSNLKLCTLWLLPPSHQELHAAGFVCVRSGFSYTSSCYFLISLIVSVGCM